MTEQDWNPLAGRDVESTARRKTTGIRFCADYFLIGEGQLCVLLQLFYICGLPELPGSVFEEHKETFVLSSFH